MPTVRYRFETGSFPIKRYTFDDILNIERMYDERIYDNEPHTSASLLIGNRLTNMVIERPFRFGNLNDYTVESQLQRSFTTNREAFANAMLPFRSAFNNFAAETVAFFLEEESLETIVSPPVKAQMISGKEYKMRVYVQNNDIMMYDRHSAFGPPCDANNTKRFAGFDSSKDPMSPDYRKYSEYNNQHGHLPYVPPYLDRDALPYVELSFNPKESRFYSAPEIVNNLTASYQNFGAVLNPDTPTLDVRRLNYSASMGVGASLNFDTVVKLERDKYLRADPFGADKASAVAGINSDFENYGYRWVIQPKWETPTHDFTDAETEVIICDRSNARAESIMKVKGSPYKERGTWNNYFMLNPTSSINMLTSSMGMWHQHGLPATGSKGYYIRIKDEGRYGLASAAGFLKSAPSSKPNPKNKKGLFNLSSKESLSIKIGKTANKKIVKESVVAIPYYLSKDCKVSFFDLNKKQYSRAAKMNNDAIDKYAEKAHLAATRYEVFDLIKEYDRLASVSGPGAVDSIAYQLRMMRRYILPPFFDFLSIDDIDPFVIYFFEFNAEFNTTDLSNIWQNLYPESAGSTATARYTNPLDKAISRSDVVYSSHILDSSILNAFGIGGNSSNYENPKEFLEEEVRWMVFKCKYRAINDYQYLVKKSIDPIHYFERYRPRNAIDILGVPEGVQLPISYNWPYDYFSFVELVKLESKVDFYGLGYKQE